jgi:hypothetical protein
MPAHWSISSVRRLVILLMVLACFLVARSQQAWIDMPQYTVSLNVSRLLLEEINVVYQHPISERSLLSYSLGYKIPQAGDEYTSLYYGIGLYHGNIGLHQRMMHGPRMSIAWTWLNKQRADHYHCVEFFGQYLLYDEKYYRVKFPKSIYDPQVYFRSMRYRIGGIRLLTGRWIPMKSMEHGTFICDIYYGIGLKFGVNRVIEFKHLWDGDWYFWAADYSNRIVWPTLNLGINIGYRK